MNEPLFEECLEEFYGYLRPGDINGMEWGVPRECTLPLNHLSNHGYIDDYYPPKPPRLTAMQKYFLNKKGAGNG